MANVKKRKIKEVIKNESSDISYRIPFVDPKLQFKIEKARQAGKTHLPIKTWSRRSTILPYMVGFVFHVHNGKKFIPVSIKEEMILYKLGDFSPTRTFGGHGEDKKKK